MGDLISVVMPVYNNQQHLKIALDSVFAQDYVELEVIVVDDGSTDNSVELASSYGDKVILIQQQNAGPAAARNRGIKRASGVAIAFLDGDDLWLPWKISTQLAYLQEHPAVGLVSNQWLAFREEDGSLSEQLSGLRCPASSKEVVADPSGDLYTHLLMESIIHTSSALLRREVVEQVGLFSEALRLGEDYEYWLRVSRLTDIAKLDCTLSVYRIHSSSIVHQPLPINYEALVLQQSLSQWGRIGRDGSTEISAKTMSQRLASSWLNFVWGNYHNQSYGYAMRGALGMIRYAPLAYKGWGYLFASAFRWLGQLIKYSAILRTK